MTGRTCPVCVRRRVVRDAIEVCTGPAVADPIIPAAGQEIPERLAAKTAGIPRSTIPEVVLGLPVASTCWAIRGTSTRFETRRGVLTAARLFRVDAWTAPTHA